MILEFTILYLLSTVISADTPFKSVLFLVSTYITVGFLIYTYGFSYLALVYVIIYAGALTILFVFAIMLSD